METLDQIQRDMSALSVVMEPQEQKVAKNVGGRPLKFKTVKALQSAIDAYFVSCVESKEPLTITGLALALDTSRDPMQYATNLVKGNPRVPYGLVGMPGTGLDKVISTISPELQRMGLNAGHAEEAAKRLFKVYLIDRFAQPNSVTGTGQ